jgi:undecaprenyl-diphosphatase
MLWWHAVILGLVEGITEYLPISSTGHLIIVSALLGLDSPDVKSSVDAFNIVIQGGAILAVLGLYRERVWQMIRGLMGKDPRGLRLAINIIIAFLPAAVLGVLLDDFIDRHLFFVGPVVGALAVGGIWMIGLDYRHRSNLSKTEMEAGKTIADIGDEIDAITPAKALAIGFFQCIAMWPGTSRSMMTIGGGVMLGLKPRAAAEFSFLLGLPTLGGACVYKLYKNMSQAADTGAPNMFESLGPVSVLIGIVVATISAAIAIKWLVGFLNKHGLMVFGIYRLILAAAVTIAVLTGMANIG